MMLYKKKTAHFGAVFIKYLLKKLFSGFFFSFRRISNFCFFLGTT